jgi:hypothetical protein
MAYLTRCVISVFFGVAAIMTVFIAYRVTKTIWSLSVLDAITTACAFVILITTELGFVCLGRVASR